MRTFMTTQARDRLYTVEDLNALEQLPENADIRLELIEGVLYPMAGGSSAKPRVVGAYSPQPHAERGRSAAGLQRRARTAVPGLA